MRGCSSNKAKASPKQKAPLLSGAFSFHFPLPFGFGAGRVSRIVIEGFALAYPSVTFRPVTALRWLTTFFAMAHHPSLRQYPGTHWYE